MESNIQTVVAERGHGGVDWIQLLEGFMFVKYCKFDNEQPGATEIRTYWNTWLLSPLDEESDIRKQFVLVKEYFGLLSTLALQRNPQCSSGA